uniref:C-type lectin domain-containing protein n=1 Tax=Gadus morhua TaxID=8049 RepID=A0A8C5AQI8_GADMO
PSMDTMVSRNGDLASVTNMEDLNQLSDMTAGVQSWIGLNDFNRKTMDLYPNSWRWSTQTRSRSFRTWWSNEPNNLHDDELCVTLYDGRFSDRDCTATFPFICSGKKYINSRGCWPVNNVWFLLLTC